MHPSGDANIYTLFLLSGPRARMRTNKTLTEGLQVSTYKSIQLWYYPPTYTNTYIYTHTRTHTQTPAGPPHVLPPTEGMPRSVATTAARHKKLVTKSAAVAPATAAAVSPVVGPAEANPVGPAAVAGGVTTATTIAASVNPSSSSSSSSSNWRRRSSSSSLAGSLPPPARMQRRSGQVEITKDSWSGRVDRRLCPVSNLVQMRVGVLSVQSLVACC